MTRKEKLKQELQRLKDDFGKMVADYCKLNPTLSYAVIGKKLGLDGKEVARYVTQYGERRPRGAGSPAWKA